MDSKFWEWFLRQVNAKRNPITEEQLRRFCASPNGPMGHPLLVEAKRSPQQVGIGEDFAAFAPDDFCWLKKQLQGNVMKLVVIQGTISSFLPNDSERNIGGRILGHGPDRTPVVEMHYHAGMDHFEPSPDVFVCQHRLFEHTRSDNDTRRCFLQANGCLLYWQSVPAGHAWRTIAFKYDHANDHHERLAEFPEEMIDHAILEADGTLLALVSSKSPDRQRIVRVRDRKEVMAQEWPGRRPDRETPLFHAIGNERWRLDRRLFHGNDSGEEVVAHRIGEEIPRLFIDGGTAIGRNPYLRGFTRLHDKRFAYVGKPTRHASECWVISGEEQPGFQRVSNLFENPKDGATLYYGLSDGMLWLMKLPSPRRDDKKK